MITGLSPFSRCVTRSDGARAAFQLDVVELRRAERESPLGSAEPVERTRPAIAAAARRYELLKQGGALRAALRSAG